MTGKVDIISFCRILTDLTNKDKCNWKQTEHTSRDRLDFESGYIEITQYVESDKSKKFYRIDVYSDDDMQYMPFEAYKGDDVEPYKVFGDLYKAIWSYYERSRSKKIDAFYYEIMDITSKQ